MKTHLLFVIQCYDEVIHNPMTQADMYTNYTEVSVFTKTEQEATEKAKSIIKRNMYRTKTVTEYETK